MQGSGNFGALIIPIAFLAIFYFIAIRPQQKKEKEIRKMREELNAGDEIITIGGIYGKVVKVKEDLVVIELSSGKVRLEVAKWAIGSVTKKKETKKNEKKEEGKEKAVEKDSKNDNVKEENSEDLSENDKKDDNEYKK
ncbi:MULTISPECIES: preprotein translocase subunit YajC [Tissierellales]|uniref:Preprotein translocase subunit YajC n=1 Tax=Acidilutibacter cellobiosedens TaxID=2507161 RepID=A0A410QBQ3_9FIRM|nr:MULTISPECIES: preprotein translocase subunit YajC [Tissierellales]QAT61389.1 preprotein translocase subunit YajC [Acidilutibacter cellobiosedens]SCL95650.1 preprotein translocase subunit YajC [Sporanaerobacter sp. PP17-6a]